MPTSTMHSNASSTPALTMATISTAWSKYSCSLIFIAPAGVCSKAVSLVAARQPSRFTSPASQSFIMVVLKAPVMMSSWCFL